MSRVLFLLPSLTSGGAERQAVTIACRLKERGYDVSFLVYFPKNFYEPVLTDNGIVVHRFVCTNFRRLVNITKFIRRGGYDTVISFMPTPNFLNCFAALWGKKWNVVISERSSKDSFFLTLKGKIYGKLFRKANAIVCNSYKAQLLWESHYPLYKERINTIYNTVSIENINTKYYPRKNGVLNVVIAATVYDIKNPMGLVNALRLMNKKERDLIHINWYGGKEAVVGNHEEYDRVVAAINDAKLNCVFKLHDATRNIANIMNEADCVALFSRLEGLPNAICEGMALGKPIIMSRCSDYNILVESGVNGFLCNWDEPSSIKEALMSMASLTSEQLIQMGNNSKVKANLLFSPDVVISQWESVINKSSMA